MSSHAHKHTGRHLELYAIAVEMGATGLSEQFIVEAVETAHRYEGVYDLMVMWRDEDDPAERGQIVADLQDMVDDCAPVDQRERPHIRFDDLDGIARDVRAFKDSLRELVDSRGGVSDLARKTGIPQPSLSRFFNSGSMPRRSTLVKIARALELSEVEIATPWSR